MNYQEAVELWRRGENLFREANDSYRWLESPDPEEDDRTLEPVILVEEFDFLKDLHTEDANQQDKEATDWQLPE